jgi:hypothetical protein
LGALLLVDAAKWFFLHFSPPLPAFVPSFSPPAYTSSYIHPIHDPIHPSIYPPPLLLRLLFLLLLLLLLLLLVPLIAINSQEPPKSGKFPFNYNGDYATERVLIICGAATLTPDDGSAVGLYKLNSTQLTHSVKASGFNP